jgi:hypothetical protein
MTPHIACSKYERFCDFKPIRSASPINGRWIDALILWRNVYPCANILMQRCTVRSRWCSSNLPRLLPLARRCNQSCWSRRQKNSTITSTSFSSSRKPLTNSSTRFSSPRKPSTGLSTRASSPRKPSPRMCAQSLVRGLRLVSGHPRPRSMDQGTRTRMSTDGPWASNHGSIWN